MPSLLVPAIALCGRLAAAHAATGCQELPSEQAPRGTGRLASRFDWTVTKASFVTSDGARAVLVHSTAVAFPWAKQQANKLQADTLAAVRHVGDPMIGLFSSDFGHVIVEKFGANDVEYDPPPADVRIRMDRPCFVDSPISTWVDGLKKSCWPKGYPSPSLSCVPLEGPDPSP